MGRSLRCSVWNGSRTQARKRAESEKSAFRGVTPCQVMLRRTGVSVSSGVKYRQRRTIQVDQLDLMKG